MLKVSQDMTVLGACWVQCPHAHAGSGVGISYMEFPTRGVKSVLHVLD